MDNISIPPFPDSHVPSGLEEDTANVSLDDMPSRADARLHALTPSHHPQNDGAISRIPGGDCKRLCVRHQRMVDFGVIDGLQKSIESLPLEDQQAVNQIWSLFSSSRSSRRILILRGILTMSCASQLSFLSEELKRECRMDPFTVLPREIAFKIMRNLDAISLGRAAQVSKAWKALADDDFLWRTMCEQHIERKCDKCGWGLPLLEKRRRRAKIESPTSNQNLLSSSPSASASASTSAPRSASASPPLKSSTPPHSSDQREQSPRPPKRSRIEEEEKPNDIDLLSEANENAKSFKTRPWKSVYCERLAIERNWRRGSCSVSVMSGHTDAVTCLQVEEDFSYPSFPIMMSGSWDRTVRIWNLDSGQCISVLRGHTRGVRALQFDSVKLITGGMDGTLRIWNWRSGECIRVLEGHRDAVISLCFDKQVLCSGSANGVIKVWDFASGECFPLNGHSEFINSLVLWSPGEDTCSGDGNKSPMEQETPSPPKKKYLLSASDDCTIRLWDLHERRCIRVLNSHVAQVQSIKLLLLDDPEDIHEHGISKSNSTKDLLIDGRDPSPERRTLSSTSQPSSSRGRPSLEPLDIPIGSRPLLVSASLDNTVKLWDLENATCIKTMFGHVEGIWSVAADKLRIATASHDRSMKIWDRATGRCLHTLVGHRGAVTSLSLMDDKIISGSDDGDIRNWYFGP